MNISFWNIRGCRRHLAMEEVKDFSLSHQVQVMMLCETKYQVPPKEGCVRHCGFQHFDYLPSMGLAGVIWLLWKDNASNPFTLSVIHKSERFIACHISLLAMECSFVAIFYLCTSKFCA